MFYPLLLTKLIESPSQWVEDPLALDHILTALTSPDTTTIDEAAVARFPHLHHLAATQQGERYQSNTKVLGHITEVSRLMATWEKAKGMRPVAGIPQKYALLGAMYHDVGKSPEVVARGIPGNYERHQLVSALIFWDEITSLLEIPIEIALPIFHAIRIHQTPGMFTTGEYLYSGERLFSGPMKLQYRSGRIINYTPEDLFLMLGGDDLAIDYLRALAECDVKSIREGHFWDTQKTDGGENKQSFFDRMIERIRSVRDAVTYKKLGAGAWQKYTFQEGYQHKVVLWDRAADTDLVCDIEKIDRGKVRLVHPYSDDEETRRVEMGTIDLMAYEVEWSEGATFHAGSKDEKLKGGTYEDISALHPLSPAEEQFSEQRFPNINQVIVGLLCSRTLFE